VFPWKLPFPCKAVVFKDKVAGVGFDWENRTGMGKKYRRNLKEFQEEVKDGNVDAMEAEFGECAIPLW